VVVRRDEGEKKRGKETEKERELNSKEPFVDRSGRLFVVVPAKYSGICGNKNIIYVNQYYIL